jgi:hypothetical protein
VTYTYHRISLNNGKKQMVDTYDSLSIVLGENKEVIESGTVAYNYNPSYLGGGDQEDHV